MRRRRERFFASAARGKKGSWSTEDWYFAIALVGLVFLGYYLAQNYAPGKYLEEYRYSVEY